MKSPFIEISTITIIIEIPIFGGGGGDGVREEKDLAHWTILIHTSKQEG